MGIFKFELLVQNPMPFVPGVPLEGLDYGGKGTFDSKEELAELLQATALSFWLFSGEGKPTPLVGEKAFSLWEKSVAVNKEWLQIE